MDESLYKAPGEKDATPMAREPQNETFWTVTFTIGALFWAGSTLGMISTALGVNPPPPDKVGLYWRVAIAAWILGAAFTLLAAIKLLRRA
ncbi:MAG TPA: hypothetical protein VHC22_12545 [Pirellulales bacterium]|nr:hypothetical protein [Pirellulales bacterium]